MPYKLSAARERAVDHVDGVLHAVDGDEGAEARALLLAEQHLIEHVEPVERHARLAILGFLLLIEEGLAAAEKGAPGKPEADLNKALAEAYEGAGETEKALLHTRRAYDLKERIYGEERQRAMAEMQARFDVERAERERELFRLKSEHLEQMIEQRSKELTSMAMHLVQKKMFLQKLRKDVTALSQHYQEGKGMMKEILGAIAGNLHDDDDWERFEREFQHVHQGFVTMLSERCPRLTPTELKVCALLKINLSNKEIARLLSVSLRNVESHRYSIRKKLGLPSDANLSSHLAGLQGRQG